MNIAIKNDCPSHGIIGDSPLMLDLFKKIEKISLENCSVLIEGETGTGKELVTRAIHDNSSRVKAPLVSINCGAFPKDLIQAELFGYEKGAFTGAEQIKIGRIESAQGGTLFLDEVGDLPFTQQANLLRFLEEKKIVRVGGLKCRPVDVRVISATHVNLLEAVKQGKFREDLYHRLSTLKLKVPPLRDRGADLELLTQHFFNEFAEGKKYTARGIKRDVFELFRNYDWPGNVRELHNVIRQAFVMSDNQFLTASDFYLDSRFMSSRPHIVRTLEEARCLADREAIMASLRHTNFNLTHAAKLLGITRVSLYRLIQKYSLAVASKLTD